MSPASEREAAPDTDFATVRRRLEAAIAQAERTYWDNRSTGAPSDYDAGRYYGLKEAEEILDACLAPDCRRRKEVEA
jgi:hypothetical protein